MNNKKIKYKDETIWSSSETTEIFRILSDMFILNLNFYGLTNTLELNFNNFEIEEIELIKEGLEKLKSTLDKTLNIEENKKGHKLHKILKGYTLKEFSKFWKNYSKNEKRLLSLIENSIKLLNEEDIFTSEKKLNLSELVGEWKSYKSEELPVYGINFNMINCLTSHSGIELSITPSYFEININVIYFDTNKSGKITILRGKYSVIENNIIVSTEENNIIKTPIISLEEKEVELYLLQTKITFKKNEAIT